MMRVFILWLPFAVAITGITLFAFVAVRQSIRLNANDPQTAGAEDISAELNQGAPLNEILPQSQINMAKSLDPVVIVTNSNGKVLGASGQLNGTQPVPPQAALASSKSSGENSITWSPTSGLNEAAVIVPYSSKSQSGYVIVARSLREFDSQASSLDRMAFITLFGTLIATFLIVMVPGSRDLIQ